MKALVTGANGFIGRAVCAHLVAGGHRVRSAVRNAAAAPAATEIAVVPALTDCDAVERAVSGIDVVIHLAARVHQRGDRSGVNDDAYTRTNVDATRMLFDAAARSGVARFVFASSVKAVGERTSIPWTDTTVPHPIDAYGRSKLAAERLLADASTHVSTDVAILRLPIVYGPGVKANMRALFRLVDRGWPLPLGAASAPRSMLYIGNLLAALDAVLAAKRLSADPYFVSDGHDVTVAELIRKIGLALDRRAHLVPIPGALFRAAATVGDLGRRGPSARLGAIVDRLFTPLQVDVSRLARDTGYVPPFSVDDGLAATARWYRGEQA